MSAVAALRSSSRAHRARSPFAPLLMEALPVPSRVVGAVAAMSSSSRAHRARSHPAPLRAEAHPVPPRVAGAVAALRSSSRTHRARSPFAPLRVEARPVPPRVASAGAATAWARLRPPPRRPGGGWRRRLRVLARRKRRAAPYDAAASTALPVGCSRVGRSHLLSFESSAGSGGRRHTQASLQCEYAGPLASAPPPQPVRCRWTCSRGCVAPLPHAVSQNRRAARPIPRRWC